MRGTYHVDGHGWEGGVHRGWMGSMTRTARDGVKASDGVGVLTRGFPTSSHTDMDLTTPT